MSGCFVRNCSSHLLVSSSVADSNASGQWKRAFAQHPRVQPSCSALSSCILKSSERRSVVQAIASGNSLSSTAGLTEQQESYAFEVASVWPDASLHTVHGMVDVELGDSSDTPNFQQEEDSGFDSPTTVRDSSTISTGLVQWYPGHIARAERQLKEQLKLVDVVLEVRDARIQASTHHPHVASWCGPKPRVLVINRMDEISDQDRLAWMSHYQQQGIKAFWTDGKMGGGVKRLKAYLVTEVGKLINERRVRRGLKPRPVRACVIGFPNIGKSALINRLISRRVVDSAPKPGVTRSLRWVRLDENLELLDAPGVIPMSFRNQVAAQRLAICNDIGEAAYLDAPIASCLIDRIRALPACDDLAARLSKRYGFNVLEGTTEDVVVTLAARLFFGDLDKAGQRILNDYRTGLHGSYAIELPSDIPARGPSCDDEDNDEGPSDS